MPKKPPAAPRTPRPHRVRRASFRGGRLRFPPGPVPTHTSVLQNEAFAYVQGVLESGPAVLPRGAPVIARGAAGRGAHPFPPAPGPFRWHDPAGPAVGPGFCPSGPGRAPVSFSSWKVPQSAIDAPPRPRRSSSGSSASYPRSSRRGTPLPGRISTTWPPSRCPPDMLRAARAPAPPPARRAPRPLRLLKLFRGFRAPQANLQSAIYKLAQVEIPQVDFELASLYFEESHKSWQRIREDLEETTSRDTSTHSGPRLPHIQVVSALGLAALPPARLAIGPPAWLAFPARWSSAASLGAGGLWFGSGAVCLVPPAGANRNPCAVHGHLRHRLSSGSPAAAIARGELGARSPRGTGRRPVPRSLPRPPSPPRVRRIGPRQHEPCLQSNSGFFARSLSVSPTRDFLAEDISLPSDRSSISESEASSSPSP